MLKELRWPQTMKKNALDDESWPESVPVPVRLP
jgi:hypothetical protein